MREAGRVVTRERSTPLLVDVLTGDRTDLAALGRGQAIVRMLPVYGLPILTLLLIACALPAARAQAPEPVAITATAVTT